MNVEPAAAHGIAYNHGLLPMWTVYDKPTDYPQGFVARMHVCRAGEHNPTAVFVTGKTLDKVRAQLPPGLVKIDRAEDDEPHIVEVWL